MTFKRSMKKHAIGLAVGAALGLAAASSHAELVLVAPEDFGGTGLGAVNTILTIQSPASTSTENGQVAWNGSADVITGATALTGASQTQTRTLGELGILSASSLRVVFNAAEPSGDAITLTDLTLTIYNTNGTTFFTAPLDPDQIAFADTFTGTGNSGFVFGLDAPETAALQALFTPLSPGAFSALRVGLFAGASNATGGNETFFVANSGTPVPPTAIPEPETYAMMLAGLGMLGFIARRRKRNQV